MASTAQAPGADGERLLNEAREAADRGEYAQAAALYSRLTGNPNPNLHVAGLLGLADSRYRLDDEEGALQTWIVATQAPETALSWQAWVALAGARVRQGDNAGAARAYREAERRAPLEERANIQSRLGWLNKEMGKSWTANRYFGRARAGAFAPVATWAILAITVAVSLWTLLNPSAEPILDLLALDKEAVSRGEYWRLLTVALVHGSLLHLLFNMYALYIVGPIVEVLYGRVLFVAFYLLAAAAGSLASYLFFPQTSVGASGAIFGMFGLLFVSVYVHKPMLGREASGLTRQIGILIVINLVIGFGFSGFGPIDNAAHVGGLLAGAWLGLVVPPKGTATLAAMWQRAQTAVAPGPSPVIGVLRFAAVVLVVVVVVIGLQVTPFWA